MTVELVARKLDLWEVVCRSLADCPVDLLERLAALPLRPSRATRSLGCYVTRLGEPCCIRLQFAQEPEHLGQTLLHEIAHFCDHQLNQPGRRYRKAHGPSWQRWAERLGIPARSSGRSEALNQLYQQRLKLVAVCQKCGVELRRARALNRRRKYLHVGCGGQLHPVE